MAVRTKTGKKKAGQQGGYFVRFSLSQRVQHIVLIITFVALALTGLAQKYYTAGWANWLILGLGGIEVTRLIHRIFAIVFMGALVYHFVEVFWGLLVKHNRPSMFITRQDFKDAIQEVRYSFGLADKPPEYGRYDYKQKFEYWGIIMGSFIIIISGLVLMFPVFVTQIFPGEFVPAAKEFHGNEATLAVIVIVIWHLYDVIIRPGIFPADTTIFTGRMSIARMKEEHALEYSEVMSGADKALEKEPVIPESNTAAEQA